MRKVFVVMLLLLTSCGHHKTQESLSSLRGPFDPSGKLLIVATTVAAKSDSDQIFDNVLTLKLQPCGGTVKVLHFKARNPLSLDNDEDKEKKLLDQTMKSFVPPTIIDMRPFVSTKHGNSPAIIMYTFDMYTKGVSGSIWSGAVSVSSDKEEDLGPEFVKIMESNGLFAACHKTNGN